MPKSIGKLVGIVIVVAIVILGIAWLLTRKIEEAVPSVTYRSDTTLAGEQTVPAGERYVVQHGSTLTIDGNYTVTGTLDCTSGPLTLVVSGNLTVNGTLRCNRDDRLPDNDAGNGILVAVLGTVEISKDAQVVTNGHVQFVRDASSFLKTTEEVEKTYNAAVEDSGEGVRIGPFIEIPFAEGQVSLQSPQLRVNGQLENGSVNRRLVFRQGFIPIAYAQEPAVDEAGNPVPNTVKLGGKWIVGDPSTPPPGLIDVQTPPKDIKKILIVYDFGKNGNVQISDLMLFGPDGRAGEDKTGGCNVQGGKGEDAFRMLVQAADVTIARFELHLGNGGRGGSATTDQNCDPGIANGGNGGKPGNLKITASKNFAITGSFDIYPGQGGEGGSATAFGKDGQAACPGENGSDAVATGGNGGDNKQGLKVTGTIQGLENVTIHEIAGGNGGEGTATGGAGGNGNGPKCAGGKGGDATAQGGKGGDATSRKFESRGGDGGDATATAGRGGDGGKGTQKDPGGNGGNGGKASTKGGKGGSGKTTLGTAGTDDQETGGNGGNGGDGCPEGRGGKGGAGKIPGKDGVDGKNICPPPAGQPAVGEQPPGGQQPPEQPEEPQEPPIGVIPGVQIKKHIIGESPCPDPFGSVALSGPAGGTWQVDTASVPAWLSVPTKQGTLPAQVPMSFNCNISNYTTHAENATLRFTGATETGQAAGEATVQVTVNVEAR